MRVFFEVLFGRLPAILNNRAREHQASAWCLPSYDAASHMLLLSTISIFFENSYMSLSLFFSPLCIMLVGSLKKIPEFLEPFKFLFILKIFLLL